MSKYLLVGLLLLSMPAMAENNVYDGPVAIRPLTVVPKGYPAHPPITIPPKVQPREPNKVMSPSNKVCDYQNQCYSTDSTTHKNNAPIIANAHHVVPNYPQPIPYKSHEGNTYAPTVSNTPPVIIADAPSVSSWKNCMSRALGVYYQTHNQQLLHIATDRCQGQLGSMPVYNNPTLDENNSDENLTQTPPNNRRDIGCGWWPIGSDADRDCASGRFNQSDIE